jgi:methionyl-tRNA formyltransferase
MIKERPQVVSGRHTHRMLPSLAPRQNTRSRIVLFTERNSPFGENFFRKIQQHRKADLVAVVSSPEGHFSPDYDSTAADVIAAAASAQIPVFMPSRPAEMGAILHELRPDYFFVANYQRILPPQIFNLPRRLCINFHVGPLPRYAGLIPWHWMWLNHETNGGVAAIRTEEQVDGGDIVDEVPVPIDPNWSELEIRDAHFEAAYGLLLRLLDRLPGLSADDLRPQDLRDRTYYDRTGLVPHKCGPFMNGRKRKPYTETATLGAITHTECPHA